MIPAEHAPKQLAFSVEDVMAQEREAQTLRGEGKVDEAFALYDQAARRYDQLGEHFNSAMCYAAAATCWDIHTGWQPLQKSSSRNHLAAKQALKAGHYEYAVELFRNAALLYEKEGDYENYSECFIAAQRTRRKKNWSIVFGGKDRSNLELASLSLNLSSRLQNFVSGLSNFCADFFWGYGERPFRTFGMALMVIAASAFFYAYGGTVLVGGLPTPISFPDAVYMSVVTFTTLGYGHHVPLGGLKLVAMTEALSGILMAPLFLVALTRRFLRMYR